MEICGTAYPAASPRFSETTLDVGQQLPSQESVFPMFRKVAKKIGDSNVLTSDHIYCNISALQSLFLSLLGLREDRGCGEPELQTVEDLFLSQRL
jgi:hypothetical protein